MRLIRGEITLTVPVGVHVGTVRGWTIWLWADPTEWSRRQWSWPVGREPLCEIPAHLCPWCHAHVDHHSTDSLISHSRKWRERLAAGAKPRRA